LKKREREREREIEGKSSRRKEEVGFVGEGRIARGTQTFLSPGTYLSLSIYSLHFYNFAIIFVV
jgi:hypothetical protein